VTVALLALVLTCGAERWDVKTLQDGFVPLLDADAGVVTVVEPATIQELRALPAPHWSNTLERQDSERRLVAIDVDLVGAKLEEDEDLHLVVADAAGTTMVVEIPSAHCLEGAPARARASILEARCVFLAFMRVGAKYKKLPKPQPVSVMGVVFIDKVHGQTGVAPNGVELHPVLSLRFR